VRANTRPQTSGTAMPNADSFKPRDESDVAIRTSQHIAIPVPAAGQAPRIAQTVKSRLLYNEARNRFCVFQKTLYFSLVVRGAYSSKISFPEVNTERVSPDRKMTPRIFLFASKLSSASRNFVHMLVLRVFTGGRFIVMTAKESRISKLTSSMLL